MTKKTIATPAGIALGIAAILCLGWLSRPAAPPAGTGLPVSADATPADPTSPTGESVAPGSLGDGRYEDGSLKPEYYWSRPPRPFPVAHKTANYEWTSEDGRDPEVMRKYSNNPEMLQRLAFENQYVPRRQLIYLPDNFAEIAQDIYDGKQQEFTLPGFDGEELTVVVTKVEPDLVPLEGSGPLSGSWKGHIKGDPTAEVFASSDSNYWSIALDSDTRQYEYENRELGEWILQELDIAEMNRIVPSCAAVPHTDNVGDLIATE